MGRFFWICLGGAAGTAARYLLTGWLARVAGAFPLGTLTVNLLGSFLIALILHVSMTTELIGPTLRLALTTGVMGGFTTYSAFNYETTRLFQDGAGGMAALNLGATILGCLLAGLLGLAAGRALVGG